MDLATPDSFANSSFSFVVTLYGLTVTPGKDTHNLARFADIFTWAEVLTKNVNHNCHSTAA